MLEKNFCPKVDEWQIFRVDLLTTVHRSEKNLRVVQTFLHNHHQKNCRFHLSACDSRRAALPPVVDEASLYEVKDFSTLLHSADEHDPTTIRHCKQCDATNSNSTTSTLPQLNPIINSILNNRPFNSPHPPNKQKESHGQYM